MAKKRSLLPRARESVNRNVERTEFGSTGIPRNDWCINPNLKKVRLESVRCYERGRTVIRVWNMLDPENPSDALLDGRLSNHGSAGLTGMSISEPLHLADYVGINEKVAPLCGVDPKELSPVTYIIGRGPHENTVEGVPFWEEPYVKLQRVVKDAAKSGTFGSGGALWNVRWNGLIMDQKHTPFKSWASTKQFVVCSIYENGDVFNTEREIVTRRKDGRVEESHVARNGVPLGEASDDPLVVLKITASAAKSVLSLCNLEKDIFQGDESANPSVRFKFGDPCGRFDAATNTVSGGLFFTLFNPVVYETAKRAIPPHTTYAGKLPDGPARYEAAVSRKYVTATKQEYAADLNAAQVARILDTHVYFWRENPADPPETYILQVLSIEQRCTLLAKAFAPVGQILEFAWMSNPEYLAFSEVRKIVRSQVSVGSNGGAAVQSHKLSAPAVAFDDDTASLDDEFETMTQVSQVNAQPANRAKPSAKKPGSHLEAEFGGEETFGETAEVATRSRQPASAPAVDNFDDDFDAAPPFAVVAAGNLDGDEVEDFGVSDDFNVDAGFDSGSDSESQQLEAKLATASALARSAKRVSPRSGKPK